MNLGEHTLQVATLAAIAEFVGDEYAKARAAAEAEYRANGIKKIAITLPDGEVVGEVTVKQPGPTVKVNEADLMAWVEVNTPAEVEEYLDSAALLDEELIEWARVHRDDLLRKRVRRVWRSEVQKQAAENDGCVIDEHGEPTKVAEVTPNKPNGAFALSPDKQGVRARRLLDAYRANELGAITRLAIDGPAEGGDTGG